MDIFMHENNELMKEYMKNTFYDFNFMISKVNIMNYMNHKKQSLILE